MHSILIYFKLTSDSQKYSTASIFLFQTFFNKSILLYLSPIHLQKTDNIWSFILMSRVNFILMSQVKCFAQSLQTYFNYRSVLNK